MRPLHIETLEGQRDLQIQSRGTRSLEIILIEKTTDMTSKIDPSAIRREGKAVEDLGAIERLEQSLKKRTDISLAKYGTARVGIEKMRETKGESHRSSLDVFLTVLQ